MWCCSDVHASVLAVIPTNAGIHGVVALARHPGASRDPVLLLFASTLTVSMATRAFALARESLFFVWPKKSNQKKGHPGGTPSALRAAGAQAGSEFSEGTSLCRPGNYCKCPARILRAALRVLPILLAAPQGPRTSESESNSNSAPPQSSPALRAREQAGSSDAGNGRLHRVREGLNNSPPFHGSREPVAGRPEAVPDFRLPATGYRLAQGLHQSSTRKGIFIQRFPGKNPFPLPLSPFPASS